MKTLKKIQNIWGVNNFLPESQEDQVSIAKHKEFLKRQSQLKSQKQDIERISNRMSKTFADRRQLIVVERKTVGEIKVEYPLLFNANEVSL